jgi:hypothetical protein
MNELNGYTLMRDLFDFSYENPEKINPNHIAMYAFIVEHCNRLGWKKKFGLPTEMTKDAIGIKNYRTFRKTFDDLVDWGFIELIQKSKNQYSANVIALVKNTKAHTKALTKAVQKHMQKQCKSIVCIDKPINLKPINQENINSVSVFEKIVESFKSHYRSEWSLGKQTGLAESQKEQPDVGKLYQIKRSMEVLTTVAKFASENDLRFVMQMTGQLTFDGIMKNRSLQDADMVTSKLLGVENSQAVKKKKNPSLKLHVMDWIRRDQK